MREEERFLRCAFCDAKGLHYSDSCPASRTVAERREIIWCRLCLDTMHRTDKCKRAIKRCNYCGSFEHHTAICVLLEEKDAMEKEYADLRRQLDEMENVYGGPSSSTREYH
ncbi:hypothetical protein Aduo_012377 [Ancylostoma duodenale]